jgi:hypothetical protein
VASGTYIHDDPRNRHAPVLEDEFFETILCRTYWPGSFPKQDFIESQNLAIVCFVLAIGTLVDTDKPPRCPEAHRYYELGCVALSIDSPLEQPSIAAIQAIVRCRNPFLLGRGSRC